MKSEVKDISEILLHYDIGSLIEIKSVLESGFQSNNLHIRIEKGDYVVRTLFFDDEEQYDYALFIYEYLATHGFKTPNTIRTKMNNLYIKYYGEKIAIQTFLKGKPKPYLKEEEISKKEELLELYGRELGRLHKASYLMVEDLGVKRFQRSGSDIPYVVEASTKYMPENDYIKKECKKWINDHENFDYTQLTSAVIHGDIGPKDFFFENDKFNGIIDLNDVHYNCLLSDIAPLMMYTGLFEYHRGREFKKFMKAYLLESPMKLEELKWLPFKLRSRWLGQILYHQYRYDEGITQGSETGEVEENLKGVSDGILFLKETNSLPEDHYYKTMKE